MAHGADDPSTLEEAKEVIARLEKEIAGLRQRVEDDRTAEDLRDVLVQAVASGTIGSPIDHDRLLEMTVQTAAHVIKARAASLFMVDAAKGEMVFEVAIGPKAQAVKKFRIPVGQGVAGLVAATGQPMAVANAQEDQRLLEDIGDKVGYEPQSLLAVPLFYGDRVIGVLELLDKEGAPTFSPADMEALGWFANQAAVALELSRTYRHIGPLIGEVLASIDDREAGRKMALTERTDAFASHIEEEPSYAETLELAELVQVIAWEGDEELAACRTILRAFADFLRSRPDPLAERVRG